MNILAVVFVLIFLLIIWFLIAVSKKKYQKLAQHLHGTYSWMGQVSFLYKDKKLKISNVGTGNISSGLGGGSYHKLAIEIDKNFKFFLGPKTSYS